MSEPTVRELSEEETWEMLRRHELGRLAYHLADEVHIVPVNYAVDTAGRLVLRTGEGSKLLGMAMDDKERSHAPYAVKQDEAFRG